MISSQNKTSDGPVIAPRDLGVMLGVMAGLGSCTLFGTRRGRKLSDWLVTLSRELREEIEAVQATPRSKAYKELTSLMESIKQADPVSLTTPKTPRRSILTSLKSQLFASEVSVSGVNQNAKKIGSRRFHHVSTPSKQATRKRKSK